MTELTDSMQGQYCRVMDNCLDVIYTEAGGAAKLPLSPELVSQLWDIGDGLPVYIYKWLNCRGSLQWIIDTTPEIVQRELDKAEATIKQAYTLLGLEYSGA